MILQPVTVYQTVQEPTAQTTIVDVLVGAAAVALGVAGAAVVLGLVCAGLLIMFRRLRGEDGRSPGDTDATRLGLDASSSEPQPKP